MSATLRCPNCNETRLEDAGTSFVRCPVCQTLSPRAHALQHASRLQAGLTPEPRPWCYRLDTDALCYPSVLGIQLLDLHLPNPLEAVEVLADYERRGRTRRFDCGECQDWRPGLGLAGQPGRLVEVTDGASLTYVVARAVTEEAPLDHEQVDFPVDREERRLCGQTNQRLLPPAWNPDPGPDGSCCGCVLSYLDRVDEQGNVVREDYTGYRPQHPRASYRDLAELPSERTRARFWSQYRRTALGHGDQAPPAPEPGTRVVTAVFSVGSAWLLDGNWWGQVRRGRDTGWSASRWVGRAPYRLVGGGA